MSGTATQRLDDITDSAWMITGALLLIVVAHRILSTLELLAIKTGVNTSTVPVRVAYLLIMTVVGISSITLALSDEWCRSIVSALSVGLGFALREIVVEVFLGIQMSSTLSRGTFNILKDTNLFDPTKLDDSDKLIFSVASRTLLSCTLNVQRSQTAETSAKTFKITVPWSWLHKQLRTSNN